MALRYLLLAAGGPEDALADALATRLGFMVLGLGRHRLLVNDPGQVLDLGGGRGYVLGLLFRTGPPSRRVLSLSDREAAILADDAERAGRLYWGGYVALLDRGGRIEARRDPSGFLPCLHSFIEGRPAVFSDVGMLMATGRWRPVVEQDEVVRGLWTGNMPGCTTALRGVADVQPGTQATFGAEGVRTAEWWSPWAFATEGAGSPTDRDGLRDVVVDACASLCAPYARVLLGVSGGLDSSIVAASVPNGPARLTCFTASTLDPRGDERLHSRELAKALQLRLREEWYACDPEDLRFSATAHLPNPCSRATVGAYARLQLRIADQDGSEAFLSGHGGDNVFGFSYSAAPVIDRSRVEGLLRAAATVGDVASLTGAGASAVMRAAWRRWRTGGTSAWRRDGRFLTREAVEAQQGEAVEHPWLRGPRDALPGKAAHVAAILRAQVHVGGIQDRTHPPTLCPLLSQPVMEACLRVPSWLWCRGGVDRAPARAAFASALPASVLERRSKGSPDGHAQALFHSCSEEIWERLRGGRLVRAGAIDAEALDGMIADDGAQHARDVSRVLELLDAEVWIDHWSAAAGAGADQLGGGRDPETFRRSLQARQRGTSTCDAAP